MNRETIEGNISIAIFMGFEKLYYKNPIYKEPYYDNVITRQYELNEKDFEYHSSWDWQIPVWCKLAHEVKEWLLGKHKLFINKYFLFCDKYEKSVFNNEPQAGHQIIVEMFNWYNQNKETII